LVPKVKRRVKYFYDYKNLTFRGNIKFLFRRINLSEDFSKFPFQNNSVSKLVGFTPDYVGGVTGGIMKRSRTNFDTLSKIIRNEKYDDIYKLYVKELISFREVISAGYNTGISQFKNYFKEPDYTQNVTRTVEICNYSKFKWFQMPEFKLPSGDDIANDVRFNPDASPGHYTRRVVSPKRKGSIKYTHQAAQDLYAILDQKPLKNYYLWEILGKQKDNKVIDGEEVASRIIMNTEEPMVLLLSLFSQRLSILIQNDKNNRIFIGKTQTSYIANVLEQKRKDYDFTVESDWTQFDSNITREDMMVAGSILLSNLDMKEGKARRCLYLIISSLITKYIVMSPGIVMRCDKGLPSGHPFTSLITSVVNLVYWCRIGYEIYGKNYSSNMDIVVQGDDANVFFKEHENLARIDDIIENLGIKSDKISGTFHYNPGCDDIDVSPVFLKRKHLNDCLVWDRKSIIRRIIYQWSKTSGHKDDIVILRNYMVTAPDDDLMNELLIDIIEYKYRELGYCESLIQENIKKLKTDIFEKHEENIRSKSLASIFDFYYGVINKPSNLEDLSRREAIKIDRRKYIFTLYTAFPPDGLVLYKEQINSLINKRDLMYLVEHIAGGVPPNVLIDKPDELYYRF